MAAGAFTFYSNAALEMGNGNFDFSTDTYIFALLTTSYTPAPNTDSTWANVSADEVASGGGYTAGGVVLSGVSYTLATATTTFTATSPTWASFSATFRYGVVVRRAGGSVASSDLLLCYSDLGGGSSIIGGGGTLTVTISGSGVFTITHSP